MPSDNRYAEAEAFLCNLDEDWARAIDLIGPCRHDPKAAREPYEALTRAIAYQQLTAKAGERDPCPAEGAVSRQCFPHAEPDHRGPIR